MALESVYSCYVDGRPIENIEYVNGTFEIFRLSLSSKGLIYGDRSLRPILC